MDSRKKKIIEKLRKVYELSTRGVDGERITANQILSSLCRRHGISMAEIIGEEVKTHVEDVPMKDHDFFQQIIANVCGNDVLVYWYRGKRREIGFDCTAAQRIEIVEKYKHYIKKYNEALKDFYVAFILKNDLAAPADPDKKEDTMSYKERLKLRNLMDGIEKTNYQKKLENG